MASINRVKTIRNRKRTDPLLGKRERKPQAPARPVLLVATGRREGRAVGADCPRCGGRHRYEPDEAVSVVTCPRTGGKLVVAVEGGAV